MIRRETTKWEKSWVTIWMTWSSMMSSLPKRIKLEIWWKSGSRRTPKIESSKYSNTLKNNSWELSPTPKSSNRIRRRGKRIWQQPKKPRKRRVQRRNDCCRSREKNNAGWKRKLWLKTSSRQLRRHRNDICKRTLLILITRHFEYGFDGIRAHCKKIKVR